MRATLADGWDAEAHGGITRCGMQTSSVSSSTTAACHAPPALSAWRHTELAESQQLPPLPPLLLHLPSHQRNQPASTAAGLQYSAAAGLHHSAAAGLQHSAAAGSSRVAEVCAATSTSLRLQPLSSASEQPADPLLTVVEANRLMREHRAQREQQKKQTQQHTRVYGHMQGGGLPALLPTT